MAVTLCTMCEEAPATTTWGFPVCQPCADALDATQADLNLGQWVEQGRLRRLGEATREQVAAVERLLTERPYRLIGPSGPVECCPDRLCTYHEGWEDAIAAMADHLTPEPATTDSGVAS